jgi:hypothetical protein
MGHKRGALPHAAVARGPREAAEHPCAHPTCDLQAGAAGGDRAGGYLMIEQYVGKLDGRPLAYGSGFTLKG